MTVPVAVLAAEALDVALEALHCRQQVCLHAGLDLHKSVLVLYHLKTTTHSHLYFFILYMDQHYLNLPVRHTNNDKNKQLKITVNKTIKQETETLSLPLQRERERWVTNSSKNLNK